MTTIYSSPVFIGTYKFAESRGISMGWVSPKSKLCRHLMTRIKMQMGAGADYDPDRILVTVQYYNSPGVWSTFQYRLQSILDGLVVPFNYTGISAVSVELVDHINHDWQIIYASQLKV